MDTIANIRNFLLIWNDNFIYVTLVFDTVDNSDPLPSVTEQPKQSLSKVDQIVSLLLTTWCCLLFTQRNSQSLADGLQGPTDLPLHSCASLNSPLALLHPPPSCYTMLWPPWPLCWSSHMPDELQSQGLCTAVSSVGLFHRCRHGLLPLSFKFLLVCYLFHETYHDHLVKIGTPACHEYIPRRLPHLSFFFFCSTLVTLHHMLQMLAHHSCYLSSFPTLEWVPISAQSFASRLLMYPKSPELWDILGSDK